MEFVFHPSPLILWIIILVFFTTIVGLLFKQGSTNIKIIIISIVSIILAILFLLFFRETHLRVSSTGFYSDTYGEFSLAWEDITEILTIPELNRSAYNPVKLLDGKKSSINSFGWFKLQNGFTARVAVASENRCLVIRAGQSLYLFAPEEFELFTEAVHRYFREASSEKTENQIR